MIELAAYQGTSFISRAIRWQTRSRYSHVAARFTGHADIKAPQQYGRSKIVSIDPGCIIEAWKGGVRLEKSIGSNHTPGTKVDIFAFKKPLTQLQEIAMTRFLVAQLGKEYDYQAIIRFLTREPVNRLNKAKWFCSELFFEAALVGGQELLERCAAWEIPPRDPPRSPLLKFIRQEVTT